MADWQPGERISWRHYWMDGEVVSRTGVVWSAAPDVEGARMTVWVVPDEPLPGDLYGVLAVGKANGRVGPHGEWRSRQRTARGEVYASADPHSPLGRLAWRAAEAAQRTRAASH